MKNNKIATLKQYNRIIFFLSLIGIIIAAYVTQSFIRKTGIYCVSSGCELVRKSSESYLFGVFPVPAVGLIGYTILTICAFLRTMNYERRTMNILLHTMLFMATFGVLFVTWFTYTELFVIHGICTWCAISACIMMVICALAWKMHFMTQKESI